MVFCCIGSERMVWCLWVQKYGYKYGWVIGLVFMGMEGSSMFSLCYKYAWLSPPCFLLYRFGVFGYGRLVYTKYGYKYGWVIGLVFMGMEGSSMFSLCYKYAWLSPPCSYGFLYQRWNLLSPSPSSKS